MKIAKLQLGSWNALIFVITSVFLRVWGSEFRNVDFAQGKGHVMKRFFAPLLLAVLVMVAQAGASVITSLPGGTVLPFPAVNYFGPGPQTVAPGVTWSSTNDGSNATAAVFGFDYTQFPGFYSFGSNGNWTNGLGPMAGLDDNTDLNGVTDTMTFTFAKPVSAVGGFLNYAPGFSTPTTIAVYDSNFNLIEPAFALTFTTSGADNTGQFYGFQESSADISYFVLTDNYIGITNLTVSAVPEPSTLLLAGTGLLGLLGYRRRRLGL
jgi:hypothetical protein